MPTVRTSDDPAPAQKTGWNVYTVMLLLSLLFIILAIICLAIELGAYKGDWRARTALLTNSPSHSSASSAPSAV